MYDINDLIDSIQSDDFDPSVVSSDVLDILNDDLNEIRSDIFLSDYYFDHAQSIEIILDLVD